MEAGQEGDYDLGDLNKLPVEIVLVILEFCDGASLTRFGAASTSCKGVVRSERLWFNLCRREIKDWFLTEKDFGSKQWRDAYKKEQYELFKKRQMWQFRRSAALENLKSAEPYKPSFWNKLKHKVGFISSGDKMFRVIFCGLDAAGKTTMLYKLKTEPVTTIPTIGFNVESALYYNWNFTVWDVGGPDKIRPLWRHYYAGAVALIWMIDSNDRERIQETREEMTKMLINEDFPSPFLLIYCNKQDLPNALSVREIVEQLALPRGVTVHYQSCCAVTGDGLLEGLEWLGQQLIELEKKGK